MAHIRGKYRFNSLMLNPGGFALVDWQGTVYLFFVEAGARGFTLFTYRPGDAQVSRIGAIDVSVIGAGVSCP